jgi:hypothetical protein
MFLYRHRAFSSLEKQFSDRKLKNKIVFDSAYMQFLQVSHREKKDWDSRKKVAATVCVYAGGGGGGIQKAFFLYSVLFF